MTDIPPIMFRTDDRVAVSCGKAEVGATVVMASNNGRSLMLELHEALWMQDGAVYTDMLPVFYEKGRYVDLMQGVVIGVQKA